MIKSLLLSLLSIWVVVTLTFLLMKAIPGDPFSDEKGMPKEAHEALLQYYGLKEPLLIQYGIYLKNIATWNFGPSLTYHDLSINQLILKAFPISAWIGLQAMALALVIGISWGFFSAYTLSTGVQLLTLIITTLLMSFPSFISASLLQYFFGYKFILPEDNFWESLGYTALPVITLALSPTAVIARLIRANALEILRKNYIVTARAKGISEIQVVARHCLKNAIIPLLNYFGQIFANILVGSFIIEKMYGIHGLGQWFVHSVHSRDYPMIMALTVFYSIVFIGTMEVCNLISTLLDPYAKENEPAYA